MIYSNRRRDMQSEEYISGITRKIYSDAGFIVGPRTDIREQYLGVDFSLEVKGEHWLVDEKAAITRLDGRLNTFCFELYSENNKGNIGWLVNRNLITTHYSLIYPKSKTNNIYDLDEIEIILLEKDVIRNQIIDELHKKNIHFNNLVSFMTTFGKDCNGKFYFRLNDTMELVYSYSLFPERPINCIVNKRFLCYLAIEHLIKNIKE